MNNNSENKVLSTIKSFLASANNKKNIAGFFIGALGGFIYYKTIGCSSGGCAITSNPYMSILWGGLLGYLFADIFKIKPKKINEEEKQEPEA